jgi:hypothetical protein
LEAKFTTGAMSYSIQNTSPFGTDFALGDGYEIERKKSWVLFLPARPILAHPGLSTSIRLVDGPQARQSVDCAG